MLSEKITTAVLTGLAASVVGVIVVAACTSYLRSGQDESLTSSSINTPKLKLLSWYEPDERSAEYAAYAELLGAAEGEELFEYTNTSYRDRYAKLEQLIKSGNSPDIFPLEMDAYPICVTSGYFTPLDVYIDFSSEAWSGMSEINEKLKWGGHYYCAAIKSRPAGVLWYRKSVIEQYGLQDPYELYENGEWTTEKFAELMSAFTAHSGDAALYGVGGYETASLISASCGTPIVSIGKKSAENNAGSGAVNNIMSFLRELNKKKLYYPYITLNSGSPDYDAWANGRTLFFSDEISRYQKTWIMYRDSRGWSDDEIQLVPFPRDVNADAYYYAAEPVGYMLCKNAQNIYEYRRYAECAVTACGNENAAAEHMEKLKRTFGLTDELLSHVQRIGKNETPVIDIHIGVVQPEITMGLSVQKNPFCELLDGVFYYGESYETLYANYSSQLDSAIEALNQ